jgi:hypothetical protein
MQGKYAMEKKKECAMFELHLSYNKITNSGAERLFKALEGMHMFVNI